MGTHDWARRLRALALSVDASAAQFSLTSLSFRPSSPGPTRRPAPSLRSWIGGTPCPYGRVHPWWSHLAGLPLGYKGIFTGCDGVLTNADCPWW